jgi:hypothetical protein
MMSKKRKTAGGNPTVCFVIVYMKHKQTMTLRFLN